ncbi:MAG: hypothetical protein GWP06_06090 [Actinobacteria bacterium]|nr:hypothetical protein [Actinomycetota bacterium]
MPKRKDILVEMDRITHRELKILAAQKSVSIKQCLKELVEREKKKQKEV